jgi:hypothetical protein
MAVRLKGVTTLNFGVIFWGKKFSLLEFWSIFLTNKNLAFYNFIGLKTMLVGELKVTFVDE